MYDVKKHENYDEKTRNFHKSRTAFLIVDDNIKLLNNSGMSHYEWAKSLGISDEQFVSIVRGYVLGNVMVFYKGNFEYDNDVVSCSKKYCLKIKEMCNISGNCLVYCGVKIGKPGEAWPPDLFVCEVNSNLKR